MKRTLAASVLSVVLVAGAVPAAELYVSPDGNDANPGTQARPLKTLAAARQAVRKLKTAASEAIMAAGGTISHQHGVGTDHLGYLATEKGVLGIKMLQSVCRAVDPAVTMNPGKLFKENDHVAR